MKTLCILQEYSNKQLLALVNSVDHLGRKSRQRIVATIEDADKAGKR
jgi:hypothetical protein